MNKLIRRRDVESITGLSRSSIYRNIAEGSFPRPVKIGQRAVAWRESDLALWLAARQTT